VEGGCGGSLGRSNPARVSNIRVPICPPRERCESNLRDPHRLPARQDFDIRDEFQFIEGILVKADMQKVSVHASCCAHPEKEEGQSSRNNLLLQFRIPDQSKITVLPSAVAETASINFGKSRVPPIFPIKVSTPVICRTFIRTSFFMGPPLSSLSIVTLVRDVKRRLCFCKGVRGASKEQRAET